MATHILQFALQCDSIIVLENSTVGFYGGLKELESVYGNLEQFFMKNNLVERLKIKKLDKKQKINKFFNSNRIFTLKSIKKQVNKFYK